MLTVISPAKRLDETPRPHDTDPAFPDDTAELLDVLQGFTAADVAAETGPSPKRARGAMARFVMETRIDAPGDLRAFEAGGYAWQADASTGGRPALAAGPHVRVRLRLPRGP